MNNDDFIMEGDMVQVYFDHVEPVLQATVISRPVATGDSWVLRDLTGQIVYVMLFAKMERVFCRKSASF
jgi:hypothetical protein